MSQVQVTFMFQGQADANATEAAMMALNDTSGALSAEFSFARQAVGFGFCGELQLFLLDACMTSLGYIIVAPRHQCLNDSYGSF